MTETESDSRPGDYIGDWPTGRNRIETPRHVHAFGMIALNSAMLEETLMLMLITYLSPVPRDIATNLVGDMNNRDRVDWLRAIVRSSERDEDLVSLVLYAIKCCDICFNNRNMLVHALHVNTDVISRNMTLTKRARNNPLRETRFEVSDEQLRHFADDIGNSLNFMLDLWYYKTHKPVTLEVERLPLPDKPPQPNRLTMPRPEEVHRA